MKTLIFSLTMLVSLFISAQEKGASTIPADKTLQPGSTYAIVVGISNYQDEGIPDLRFADRDAEAFANFLQYFYTCQRFGRLRLGKWERACIG